MDKTISATIGMDLGDKSSAYCVIDQASGEELAAGTVRTTASAIERVFAPYADARVVMETGTHSPWISRLVERLCAEVDEANAREAGIIYKQDRKSDRTDAQRLARFGRIDPDILRPVHHRSERAQVDLLLIRGRAELVPARTKLVNSARGLVKSTGVRLPPKGASSVGPSLLEGVPASLHAALTPMLLAVEALTTQIRALDKQVDALAARYKETERLTQVTGVGNLTALTFVLTLEDWRRFQRSRDVGAFLGLVPRRDQSGATDKQLRITKSGDRLLRTLLVQCAHYVLGRNGPPCDLKAYGERISARGGSIAKRKAVVAVARKLATLLHALWRSGEVYQPTRMTSAA